MVGSGDVNLEVAGYSIEGAPPHIKEAAINNNTPQSRTSIFIYWKWWIMVITNILLALSGKTVATLLGRFYFDQGGNSKWMSSLVVSAAFPILIPLFLSLHNPLTTVVTHTSHAKISSIYMILGLMMAGGNLMNSYGLMYLPVSTYSLICATQLAFSAIFSYFLNSQKLTHLIFNSVVLLTFSSALLGVSTDSTLIRNENLLLGFILTLGASGTWSLILSLMQLTFQRILKRETFSVVLEMMVCTSFVSTCTALIGLFASGEWGALEEEMEGYKKGRVAYVMTLVWISICWQVAGVGSLGLIFVVSSLFSNVISTVGLPLVPICAVIFFQDKIDGVKAVSMLVAIWGFLSYVYQHFLDSVEAGEIKSDIKENFEESTSA